MLLRATTALSRPCPPTSLFPSAVLARIEIFKQKKSFLLCPKALCGAIFSSLNLTNLFPAEGKRNSLCFSSLCSVPVHSFLKAPQICSILSFLLSCYFLSTLFAIFLSFISSSVIFPVYLSCILAILFSIPSLYTHIWVNLSFLTSPHFPLLLLSSPTFHFTFISALRPFSTHILLLLHTCIKLFAIGMDPYALKTGCLLIAQSC